MTDDQHSPDHRTRDEQPEPDHEAGVVKRLRESSHKQRIEIFVATLMALATVGAAWASYESTRWKTIQTKQFNTGNATRVESTKASTRGGQQVQIDVGTFFQLADAYAMGKMELFDFYRQRARKEFKPALNEWLASRPLENPDAAKTPFALPSYRIKSFAEAEALKTEADVDIEAGKRANQRSDNFVLATVVFAAVLFLAGISAVFRWESMRLAFVGLATIGFVADAFWVATMPVVLRV